LEGKPIGPDQKQELKGELMVWKVQVRVQGCSFFHFLLSFIGFFYYCCSNSSRMEETLWIEGIVESTQAPPFLINSRIDMAGFVDPHKVVLPMSSNIYALQCNTVTPMLSDFYSLQCNHFCNHSMHGHNKNKSHQYFVHSFIHCV
jgi:hypothetical protein